MPDPSHLLYAQQFFHALAGRCGGILCRMTDGNERSHCLSFGHGEHLCHLVRVIDAHDDRPEAQCVRGKAEGLCGNTGIKGLPVAFERAGITAVPLKTRASRHHRQRNQCGGMGKRVGVIGEIQHTIAGDFLTLLRIFHENIAGDLGIFPAGGISGSGHHFGHLLRGNRLFGKAADAAPGLDAFQCFHNCFLLSAVCWI